MNYVNQNNNKDVNITNTVVYICSSLKHLFLMFHINMKWNSIIPF